MPKKLLCALTFISFLMVISCAKPEEKAWRNVTSIDEILGEWEGIVSVQYSTKPDLPTLEAPVTLSFFVDNNQNYIYEETFDYDQVLDALTAAYENSFTKDELWEYSISIFEDTIYNSEFFLKKYYNSIFYLEEYYIRIRTTIPFEERDTFDCDNYQIYRSGNRLKWLYGFIVPAPFIAVEEVFLQRWE